MSFAFDSFLSEPARARSAQPFTGLPPYHFVGGNIDEPTVPADALAEAVARVIREEGHAMGKYGMDGGPQGYLPLREEICTILERRTGITVTRDEVLVTSGSLQAMDLVNKALLDAGDVVLLEDANYMGAIAKLRTLGVSPHPIALDGDGMRMDALEEALETLAREGRKPKFIYTIPTIQNPTGTIMPEARRREMLALARKYDVPIFEDDCYADLVFSGERPPAIHALDDEDRVIYCGTFSKTIAPALRMGYLVAPWPLMGHILPLKTDAGTAALGQMALAEYLPGHYESHVASLLPMLQEKSDTLCAALDEHFGAAAQYDRPVGGIYLWVTLPDSVDTDRLFEVALEQGIEINPGSQWTVNSDQNRHRMRLCFGHPPLPMIRDGIAKLAEICHAEFGLPLRSGNIARG
ncbi:aminotransferase-like domain-containing protein [Aquicoccus porphyridii]|uniref:aminotransferase-like domain-containing protein n=1 Tax=Aquicoccus porphyridii TaxID=1852029 RepID=UPI00273F3050|nr:PLP-dependent aminotransferase family protein [Aquicoccus porphyridii]